VKASKTLWSREKICLLVRQENGDISVLARRIVREKKRKRKTGFKTRTHSREKNGGKGSETQKRRSKFWS